MLIIDTIPKAFMFLPHLGSLFLLSGNSRGMARVWGGGWGAQCSRARVPGWWEKCDDMWM